MANVCVITGGGSGMGFAAAKFQPKEKIIVLSGRTLEKLEDAVAELKKLGYTVFAKACDVSNRESVKELVQFACSMGTVKNVIHAAGISPSMGTPEKVLRINALGTMYVNQEFAKVMGKNSAIVDVASTAAYTLQSYNVPYKAYKLAETDEILCLQKLLKKIEGQKDDNQKRRLAYVFSKSFVIWYAQKCAFAYGANGIRVLSVSPALVATDMGNYESKDSAAIAFTAEERMGTPEELGYALATLSDERNGFLAGVDVVCDGGCMNGKEYKKK